MKKLLLAFLLLSVVAQADDEPFKILIIADTGAASKATELQAFIRNTPPFNRMRPEDLNISIRTLSAQENRMNCRADASITRNVTCDQGFLHRIQGRERASMAVALTSSPSDYGGSGGQVPVGTINLPLQNFVHEMLHTAGLADEYPYETSDEQRRYCRGSRRKMNLAYFRDIPPYASDAAARSTHQRDVPWMGRILASTPIINGTNLGTNIAQTEGSQQIGVYTGGPCPADRRGRRSWIPYRDSIMRQIDMADHNVYPLYEQAFIDYIQPRLGRPLRLRSRTAAERARLAALEIDIPDPQVQVFDPSSASGVSQE